jgi:hypothetical protein
VDASEPARKTGGFELCVPTTRVDRTHHFRLRTQVTLRGELLGSVELPVLTYGAPRGAIIDLTAIEPAQKIPEVQDGGRRDP